MARPYKVSYLNKPELEYEVRIRLETPADSLINLKKQIEILAKDSPSSEIVTSVLPPEEDIDQAEVTLSYIEGKIFQLEQKFSSLVSKKIEAYNNHLSLRLDRIDTSSEPALEERLLSAQRKLSSLEKRHENLLFVSTESCPASTPAANATPIMLTPTPEPTSLTPTPPMVIQIPPNNLITELKKISYDGTTCPKSFLIKIEEFSTSRNISKVNLLNHSSELFTHKALHWLRFQKSRNPDLTWNTLCELLIKDFGEFDYDYKLMNTINSRTQGESETIIIYISIMSGLFSRLENKLNEHQQLTILLRNIRPSYSTFVALKNVTSIDSLISACQGYESILDRDLHFKEPKPANNHLAKEFDYVSSTPSTSNSSKEMGGSNNKPSPFTKSNYTPKYTPLYRQVNAVSYSNYCPRCRTDKHSFYSCTQPHFLICFGCGLKGVKISECPNCNKTPCPNNQKN